GLRCDHADPLAPQRGEVLFDQNFKPGFHPRRQRTGGRCPHKQGQKTTRRLPHHHVSQVMAGKAPLSIRILTYPNEKGRKELLMRTLKCGALLVTSLLMAGIAQAQVVTGDVLGTISDPTGAVVPHAKIVITNTGTHETHELNSGTSGEYVFTAL